MAVVVVVVVVIVTATIAADVVVCTVRVLYGSAAVVLLGIG